MSIQVTIITFVGTISTISIITIIPTQPYAESKDVNSNVKINGMDITNNLFNQQNDNIDNLQIKANENDNG